MLKPVLIPPDCPNHQASHYITASLSQVYKAADEIFNRIEARLNKCKENAEKIQNRIAIVDDKVKALKTTENVILTHRTRYPDAKLNNLNALFEEEDFSSASLKIDDLLFAGFNGITNQSLKDAITRKKDFGYAFSKGKHFDSFKRSNFKDKSNEARCELLDEEIIFSEKGKLVQRKDKFDFKAESLLIYDSLGKGFEADPIAYKPGFGALNTFDFPDVLPHLSGNSFRITSSTNFAEGGEFQSIAPSLRNETATSAMKNVNEAPTKEMPSQPIKPEEPKKAPEPELPEILPIVSAPLPPPPVSVVPSPVVVDTVISTPAASISSPPPPPPPPPPLAAVASQKSLPQLPDLDKGRFDLMEAIRIAGGAKKAKLKTVSATEKLPLTSASPKSIVGDDTGDDLMSSLAKALETRRKGMAGNSSKKLQRLENKKNSNRSTGPSEAFSRLRESLPVIPNDDEETHHSDGETDWK
uniref:WASH1 WAHD domain-containing protein n=1 Tax=Panagrolaimus sp. ES5 TaxID=591445 RepID=A0AC34GXP4_9BILA